MKDCLIIVSWKKTQCDELANNCAVEGYEGSDASYRCIRLVFMKALCVITDAKI